MLTSDYCFYQLLVAERCSAWYNQQVSCYCDLRWHWQKSVSSVIGLSSIFSLWFIWPSGWSIMEILSQSYDNQMHSRWPLKLRASFRWSDGPDQSTTAKNESDGALCVDQCMPKRLSMIASIDQSVNQIREMCMLCGSGVREESASSHTHTQFRVISVSEFAALTSHYPHRTPYWLHLMGD